VVANASPPDQETRPRPSGTGQRHRIRLRGESWVRSVRSSSIGILLFSLSSAVLDDVGGWLNLLVVDDMHLLVIKEALCCERVRAGSSIFPSMLFLRY
jgi:hypothetical protein